MYIDTHEDSIHRGQIRYEIKNGSIQNIDEQFDSVLNVPQEKFMTPKLNIKIL